MDSDVILVIVVATALAFDFTNGFHDTANVVATSISTRAMPPRARGAHAPRSSTSSARSSRSRSRRPSAKGIVDADAITTTIVFAGLIGAIAWNLATWYFGLPSSSSHALIGGVVGAAFAAAGRRRDQRRGPARQGHRPGADRARRSPSSSAGIAILIAYRIVGRLRPGPGQPRLPARAARVRRRCSRWRTARTTRRRRWASSRSRSSPTATSAGRQLRRARLGRRRVGDARSRSAPTPAAGGSSARWAAGSSRWTRPRASRRRARAPRSILAASHFGYPLSTTHVISGGVMGAGAAKRLSAVRWGVAGNIVVAWVLTLPGGGRDRRASSTASRAIFGTGALGPVVVVAVRRRAHRGRLRPPLAGAPSDADGRGMIASVAVQDLLELAGVSLVATIGAEPRGGGVRARRDPRHRAASQRPRRGGRRLRRARALRRAHGRGGLVFALFVIVNG